MKNNQNKSPIDMVRLLTSSRAARGVEAENSFIGVVGTIGLHGTSQYGAEREPRDKSSDVGPPRDACSARRREEFGSPLQQLQNEPDADEHECGHLEEQRNENDRHQHD